MPVTINFWQCIKVIYKGIVLWNAAIEVQTNNRSSVIFKILSIVSLTTITDSEVDMAFVIKSYAATKVVTAVRSSFCNE